MVITVDGQENENYIFSGIEKDGALITQIKPYTLTVQDNTNLEFIYTESKNRLPVGYTELEYIQSNGGTDGGYFQYPKTAFLIWRLEAEVELNASGTLYGVAIRSSDREAYFKAESFDSSINFYNGGNLVSSVENDSIIQNQKINFGFDRNKKICWINDTQAAYNSSIGTAAYNNFYIFYGKNGDTNSFTWIPQRGKLYSWKMYDFDNVLMVDYIPCREDSSGVVGIYDLVTSTFIAPQGGTFIAGPEI